MDRRRLFALLGGAAVAPLLPKVAAVRQVYGRSPAMIPPEHVRALGLLMRQRVIDEVFYGAPPRDTGVRFTMREPLVMVA